MAGRRNLEGWTVRQNSGDLAGRRDSDGLLVMEFGIESQRGECKVGSGEEGSGEVGKG